MKTDHQVTSSLATSERQEHASICRLCLAYCPITVKVQNGKAVSVAGDTSGTPYDGYTCPKGRALPEQHNDPQRILRPLEKTNSGFKEITTEDAVTRTAEKLRAIIAKHGVNSIAYYIGTGVVSNPTGQVLGHSFFNALGSKMLFSASTIDKPAANISTALHGNWVAGAQGFEDADVWMVVGGNPVIAKSNGAPPNNPAKRLKDAVKRGMKLIVVDPRCTETAQRAHIHLQVIPGEDPALLAGMIHTIIAEKLYDKLFIEENAEGFDNLRTAVSPFTPEYAAQRAGVATEDLIEAARVFAQGRSGSVVCSTGSSFSAHSNLSYYLALCLNTLCGKWGRAGDLAAHPNMLLPSYTPKAQPYAPYPVFGDQALRNYGLKRNASGLPTAALADEILTEGDGQIKALFCVGGNPVLSWPDQSKTERALEQLELLIVFDYKMTATAEFADLIIPPPLTLEIPGCTSMVESLKYIGVTRGFSIPWAQYAPAVVNQPQHADLVDDGEFFYRLAQAMNLQLELVFNAGYGPHVEAPANKVSLNMSSPPPSVDDILEHACKGSRIPLDEVKKYPHGNSFDHIKVPIEPRDPDCKAKLCLDDPMMIRELAEVFEEEARSARNSPQYPFQLICRRLNNFMNSMGQGEASLSKGEIASSIYMHPKDMDATGIESGSAIAVESSHGSAEGVAKADPSLRPGVVAMPHGFGTAIKKTSSIAQGASVTRLIGMEEYDPISGIPRMSAIPVAIRPL